MFKNRKIIEIRTAPATSFSCERDCVKASNLKPHEWDRLMFQEVGHGDRVLTNLILTTRCRATISSSWKPIVKHEVTAYYQWRFSDFQFLNGWDQRLSCVRKRFGPISTPTDGLLTSQQGDRNQLRYLQHSEERTQYVYMISLMTIIFPLRRSAAAPLRSPAWISRKPLVVGMPATRKNKSEPWSQWTHEHSQLHGQIDTRVWRESLEY